jgi:hypothetical protein
MSSKQKDPAASKLCAPSDEQEVVAVKGPQGATARQRTDSQKFGGVIAETISASSSPTARALCGSPES